MSGSFTRHDIHSTLTSDDHATKDPFMYLDSQGGNETLANLPLNTNIFFPIQTTLLLPDHKFFITTMTSFPSESSRLTKVQYAPSALFKAPWKLKLDVNLTVST